MLNIHSIKTVSSLVVYLTFDDFRLTVMMICSSDDEFGYWLCWHYYRFFAFSMYYRSFLYVL